MCPTSAATPGVPTISYRLKSPTTGEFFNSKESGCPIPPAAPTTATFGRLVVDMWRMPRTRFTAAVRENIFYVQNLSKSRFYTSFFQLVANVLSSTFLQKSWGAFVFVPK
mmetsp:Transcript_4564/g.5652  ORF Transcript_4564/g.5652 Transcript_4564/m.5652 type:complete len:110 (-) Transcript_4564:9-338(-)